MVIKPGGKAAKGNVWAGERALGTGEGGQGRSRRLRRPNHRLEQGRGGPKGTGGNAACRVRGTVDLLVPIVVSPVRPPSNKWKLDTDNTQAGHRSRSLRQRKDKATVHVAQHIYPAHTKHKGTTQPTQYTDCTTGQASLHGGGDGNYTDYICIYLKIKLSTTVLPLGHFTDPHPLYCR
jgi:hypothetical protein